MKNYFCYQLYDDDCGFACLKMLLACINNDKNYLFLENYKENGKYSFLELVNIASKYNLRLKGYCFNNIDNIKTPFICLIKGEISYHYVLVTSVYKNFVLYNDPALGKRIVIKKRFMNLFQGNYLIVDSFTPYALKEKKKRDFPFISIILILIINLVTIGILLINSRSEVLISILLINILLEKVVTFIIRNKVINKSKEFYDLDNITHQEFVTLSSNYSMYYLSPIKFIEKIIIYVYLMIFAISIFNFNLLFSLIIGAIVLNCVIKYIFVTEHYHLLKEKKMFIKKEYAFFNMIKRKIINKEILLLFIFFFLIIVDLILCLILKIFNLHLFLERTVTYVILLLRYIDLINYFSVFKKRNIYLNKIKTFLKSKKKRID